MNPNDTIRLLILNNSHHEAERLVSMLQNAGCATRAQHVESEEALTKLLQEQVWDLLIGFDQCENPSPQTAIRHIRRLNKDIPTILQTDEEGTPTIVAGMKIGASDVVRLDEDQHLLLVIQRELACREQRQLQRKAERRTKEAERRCQTLLDSSRDGIAYIQDGMYLYVNDSFAEHFSFEDRDDLECMPVVDMVAEQDLEAVKKFLKTFTLKGDDAELSELSFSGLDAQDQTIPVHVEVSSATYDEESCIQFLIRANQDNSEELEAQLKQIKDQDLITGIYNHQYLLSRLEDSLNKAVEGEQASALLELSIDNFERQVKEALGITASDMTLADVANTLKTSLQDQGTLARFSADSFMLLLDDTNADQALALAEKLRQKIESHIVDIDGHTVQLTLSIGAVLINETATNADTAVEHATIAINELREAGGNGVKLYEPKLSDEEQQSASARTAIKSALELNSFRLLFQPIISLRGSEQEHYEVMLRMIDAEGQEIAPSDFMAIAEELNGIVKMDRWAILESIKTLAEHRSKGNNTRLIVNISAHSIRDESLIPWLKVAFKAAKLPTDALLFQVSEIDITKHLNEAKNFADAIRALGCQLSVSGFGCSLNPFNTLKHFETNYVQIDGSFTLDIQNNKEDPTALVELVKELHALEKVTVVPFVENANVLSTLWQAGVHYIQGQYLQAPAGDLNYDFDTEG